MFIKTAVSFCIRSRSVAIICNLTQSYILNRLIGIILYRQAFVQDSFPYVFLIIYLSG